MSLTFAFRNEQELLEKLSDADYELAQRDLVMFGMYCVEEVNGAARRVDVQSVELHNGRMVRFAPMSRSVGELILADLFSGPVVDPIIREKGNGSANRWMNILRNAMFATFDVDTSNFPIWKKHDPGAA